MTQRGRKSWPDCFPKVTNGELLGLCKYQFTSPVQPQIVLFLVAQTRGTGRIMSGAVDPQDYDEWEEALGSYGRDTVALYDGQLAFALGRDTRQVARERRRLIAAGIVVEHQRGHKGIPHVLSVNLDCSRWRPLPPRSGANRLPQVSSGDIDVSQSAPESPVSGSQSAPDGGSQSAPEPPLSGSQSAPRVKRSSERSRSSETLKETCDSRCESRGSHHTYKPRPVVEVVSDVDPTEHTRDPHLQKLMRAFLDNATKESR